MEDMYVWLWPLLGVIILISIIATFTTMRIGKFQEQRETALDTEIADPVKRHPFMFNPIIIAYFIAAVFVFIMIAFYAATTDYR